MIGPGEEVVKYLIVFSVLLSFGQVYAAIKPCDELRAEIAEKLDAAGVKSYVLTIVETEQVERSEIKEGKVVGSCENGTKKIIYVRKEETE